MILTFEQITHIVLRNPHKSSIEFGREQACKLMLHLYGHGMSEAIKRSEYFASEDVFKEQKKYAMSNKDVFGRLLQQEDMVFSSRGGSTRFNLSDAEESQMNELIDNVRYGLSLRKWVRNFALQAYRSDPMGIIFIEVEPQNVDLNGEMQEPRAYPTYKSIFSIYDYLSNGRNLEYVIFKLTAGEARSFGITDNDIKDSKDDAETNYFRIVDDKKDLIVKRKDDTIAVVTEITQKNPLPNEWGKTPGFIVSDIMKFNDPQCFLSPLDLVVELADAFLDDRSVRNLQKKYHGFAKPIEPLLNCGTCGGEGVIDGNACPHCTPKGKDKGTGFKMVTKVSDVARFPLSVMEQGSFDWRKVFGYQTPDIEGWNKQDASLEDLEELMEMTYWGTVRMKRPNVNGTKGEPDTATEVNSNEAPKEARLNITADWAEKTEMAIADFLGMYWFDSFKHSSISIGRDWVLKSADELMNIYLTLRTKGAPDFSLDEALEKYYQAKYQSNPLQLQKYLKMLDVEPFPHLGIVQAKGIITEFIDYSSKLYFGEWSNTVPDIFWIRKKPAELIDLLKEYVKSKALTEPTPEPAKPSF